MVYTVLERCFSEGVVMRVGGERVGDGLHSCGQQRVRVGST
jgi:hypothetical protein